MAQTLARIEESMFSSVNPVVLEDPKDIDVLVSKLEARLRMRCGGLLEIQREDPNDANSPRQVVFIHRSVQEFLNAKQGTEFLSQHIEEGWDLQWTLHVPAQQSGCPFSTRESGPCKTTPASNKSSGS